MENRRLDQMGDRRLATRQGTCSVFHHNAGACSREPPRG